MSQKGICACTVRDRAFWVCLFLCMCVSFGVSWLVSLGHAVVVNVRLSWIALGPYPFPLLYSLLHQKPASALTHTQRAAAAAARCSSAPPPGPPATTPRPLTLPLAHAQVSWSPLWSSRASKTGHNFYFLLELLKSRVERGLTAGIMWCRKKRIMSAVPWHSTCLVVLWEYGSFPAVTELQS